MYLRCCRLPAYGVPASTRRHNFFLSLVQMQNSQEREVIFAWSVDALMPGAASPVSDDVKEKVPDPDGVPLRCDGPGLYFFQHASDKPNLVNHFSEWQWRVTNTRYRSLSGVSKAVKIITKV